MTDTIANLYNTIKSRKEQKQQGSYTCYLFEKGIDKILKKCGEENAELIIAAKNNNKQQITEETCDLLYHILVMLIDRDVDIADIEKELLKRTEKTGNLKQFKKIDKNT